MNKRYFIIAIIVIALLAIVGAVLYYDNNGTYLPYKDFCDKVEAGKIQKVTIDENKVFFELIGDSNQYYTDNPDFDRFKEFLLMHNIVIEDTFGTSDITSAFDMLFYIIFIGVAGFGIYKFIHFTNSNFKIIRNNHTKFSDVVGMDEMKSDIMKIVEVVKNPKMFKERGIRPPKGIILEGPPGNGKTLLARAIAGEADMNFIATKGADFQSAMMSIGPRKIRALFKKARRNRPCIIFIDEFDGIGERRNYAGTGIDKENNRLIIAMLNEMDGFSNEEGVLVIAATNSYVSLDAALVRPGRFDIKYRIDNPDQKTIIGLIELYTKNKKLDEKLNIQELAKCFQRLSSSAIETIMNEAALITETKGKEFITIEEIAEAGKKTDTIKINIK